MAKKSAVPKSSKTIETLKHDEATRKNIPTAEYQSVVGKDAQTPIRVAYERRNKDLDPQLVWRGKDEQDWSDLVVHAPPLYIQEKVHPKVLIDDLLRRSEDKNKIDDIKMDLFADFNGLPDENAKTEFYQHDAHWANRMILGDSLQVMASLAEREGLRGKVQCIYFDPPYGIKFNSNFQWSTTSRDVKDGNTDHITREPEQVKAFRDTWRDGIHSYLTYLRDRLTVARDLLTESGSIFVQIGEENVHRVRAVLDEVFGDEQFCAQIPFIKTSGAGSPAISTRIIPKTTDYIVWFAKKSTSVKYRQLFTSKLFGEEGAEQYAYLQTQSGFRRRLKKTEMVKNETFPDESRIFRISDLTSQTAGQTTIFPIEIENKKIPPKKGGWKTNQIGMNRLGFSNRLFLSGETVSYVRFIDDFPASPITESWDDTRTSGFADAKRYVVQTNAKVIERCILMTTDPGDLTLDPTCGSGTTSFVSEQLGRRWITIDTSRVALALARARIMGARYDFYHLADSPEGQRKEAEITRTVPSSKPTRGDIRQGFVYERVPHITLKSIANNSEIDVIWDKFQKTLEPIREKLNLVLSEEWKVKSGKVKEWIPLEEWQIPREKPDHWPLSTRHFLDLWWQQRIARQKEIDASIAAKAEYEYLYDKPYADNKKVRVAGPFTVESLSPHRVLGVDEDGELIDGLKERKGGYTPERDFTSLILENLKTAGVQQAHKADKINFTTLTPWPGDLVCAEGRFVEAGTGKEKRAAIFIGPEFGTVSRPDLVEAAKEAGDADFDVLITCAFNYDARSTDFAKLGRIQVLKARMNADLHMADDLKNTGKGNLFVIFGEPDIDFGSEAWIVDSRGEQVAPYEIFKLVSGTGGLAEINRLGDEDLRELTDISKRREIWDYLANAAGIDIDSSKYSGRASAADDGGISPIAWYSERLAGGTGNVSDLIRKAGISTPGGIAALVQRLRGDQQNVKRTHEIAHHSPLTTSHLSQVKVNGVDVFHPNTGEVRSDNADGIACWFVDTDYNEESFFVRHAYFLGANDPYKALKTTLKAEINEEAWQTLNSDVSRAFDKPKSGRIAVKVINHLGDEVMKVFKVV